MPEQIMDDPKALNAALLHALDADQDQFVKLASQATSEFTLRKLREDAFSPAVLPYEDIDNSMLDRAVDRDDPFMICEIEADQAAPMSISFTDSAPMAPYYNDKYMLIFHTNTTPTFIKNVDFLRTTRTDIRSILTNNALRDLSRLKDEKFIRDVNTIVGSVPGAPSPITGLEQNVQLPGRLTRSNWVATTLMLKTRQLLNGVFVMNQTTFAQFEHWTRDEMGGDFAQKLIMEGSSAFSSAKLSGIDLIVTMKADLVPNGVIYQFTKPNFLGRAGVLQKPTMYIKCEKDMLQMSCREKIGVTIANTAGVQKTTFLGVADPYGGDGRILAN